MSAAPFVAPFPGRSTLPLCSLQYVLEVYRALPERYPARTPLASALPWLPPPPPEPGERSWAEDPAPPVGVADETQTMLAYFLLALLLTSERRQRQHHRANGGRRAHRLTAHDRRPWSHEEATLWGYSSAMLRELLVRELDWAVRLGLAVRRAARQGQAAEAERCHQAFASALGCVQQVGRVLSFRRGGAGGCGSN